MIRPELLYNQTIRFRICLIGNDKGQAVLEKKLSVTRGSFHSYITVLMLKN